MKGKIKYELLGNICEFINGDRGKNYPSSKEFVDSGIPFINAGNIIDKKIDYSNMNYIGKEKFELLGSGKVQKGDVLFCLRGSLGKHAIVQSNIGAIASSLVIIRPNNSIIYNRYLMYALDSREIHRQIYRDNNGSSQPNLSAASVKKFKIYLPSINEQIKIANILDKAEELIDKRRAQIEALDELVKSKFIEMFGDPVINPKGYEKVYLDSICSNIVDCPHSTPKEYLSISQYPAIRTSELKNGDIDWQTMKYVSFDEYTKRTSRLIPKAGDIIYGREGSYGEAVMLPDNFHFCLGQRVMLLRADEKVIYPQFLWFSIRSNYVYDQAKKKNVGATVGHVNVSDVKKFWIILPDLSEQSEFVIFLSALNKLKSEMQNSLKELEDNFNSLMQKAFKGELFN